jgi:hypothetical protein
MKRSFFLVMMILGLSYTMLAQSLKEEEPVESLSLRKGNIPPAVQKAADELFHGNTQIAWGSFPYELKDYGWSVNSDYDDPIDHYEIQLKSKDGSDIFAVFESTGELIKCKIINKNAPMPSQIINSLAKSEFKDWKVVGDVMQIKSTQKKVDEHYAVKIEKDKIRKTLYYSPQGVLLTNK